jgi:hypothetical protein
MKETKTPGPAVNAGTDASPPISRARTATCPRCAQKFECKTNTHCWCTAVPYRLPCPNHGDCFCPACLPAFAAAQESAQE